MDPIPKNIVWDEKFGEGTNRYENSWIKEDEEPGCKEYIPVVANSRDCKYKCRNLSL